ncbi:hemin uptake protein HemP [Stella sp.]|uniref:hemin uptake protein HemP n=1 Tax=Stella sp. TaxID=2912054 RepID=UPI0035B0B667
MTGSSAAAGPRPAAAKTAKRETPQRIRRLDAGCLFGDGRECIIVHGDSEYRLRVTSTGKLILTK